GRGNLALRAHELGGLCRRGGITELTRPDCLGQRLEAALASDRCSRAPLGLVGEVEILERLLRTRRVELRGELRRQLALFVDAFADGRTSVTELVEILGALL